MKRPAIAALLALAVSANALCAFRDEYRLTMTLRVPAVVDNMEGKGRREYRPQFLAGTVFVEYRSPYEEPEVSVAGLVNLSHRLSTGRPCTYSAKASGPEFRALGDNGKDVFKTVAVAFSLLAEPVYNAGDDGPDNTLNLVFAGKGASARTVSGTCAGSVGCGCRALGHPSPTRLLYVPYISPRVPYGFKWWYPLVVDTAPCWGTWRMRFVARRLTDDAAK